VFGGSNAVLRTIGKQLVDLDGMYVPREDGRWTWQHSDLALRAWYRDVGSEIAFDMLHLVEWDLLLAAPLQTLYGHVPAEGVGLTALTPVAELEQEWTWLRKEPGRSEWHALLAFARDEFGYDGVPYGCVFGGSCFSRAFLQAYASVDPPRLAHDELRVPLFAQILGFPLVDTRLRGPWHGEREDPFFHFRAPEIEVDAIRAQLAEPDGWRAFHPVRAKIDAEVLLT
jgi:hypothetical protein